MAKKPSEMYSRPWCPFCGQTVEKPHEPERRKLGEFPVGNCQCGAVYASDVTGWNVGAAMIEAMVYACNDDWDLAWGLTPEDDYLTDRIEPYDEITNQIVEKGNIDGRKVEGVLYFVRLHGEAVDAAAATQKMQPGSLVSASFIPTIEQKRDPKRKKQRATKTMVQDLVEQGDIDGLVDLMFDDLKTIRFMQRLLYTIDEALRWQTIDAFGKVCARYSTRYPGKVSDLMQRLFAACTDSASTVWGNIETIGAIIAGRPDIFGLFSHHLLNFLNDSATLVSSLWALGTIAKAKPELIRSIPFYQLFKLLEHADPNVRANALRLLGRIKATEAKSKIERHRDDNFSVTIYEDGQAQQTTIAQLAEKALRMIEDK